MSIHSAIIQFVEAVVGSLIPKASKNPYLETNRRFMSGSVYNFPDVGSHVRARKATLLESTMLPPAFAVELWN